MEIVRWTTTHPFDLAASTARYTRWGPDPVNVVSDGAYHRVTRSGTAYRAIESGGDAVEVTVTAGDPEAALFDIAHRFADRLMRPFGAALANAHVAARARDFPGYRPPLVADPFEALVTAITAQQVNLRWATTTRRRVVEAFGEPTDIAGATVWAFPPPTALAGVDPAVLRSMQFTTRKAEYIVGLAEAACDGALSGLDELSNEAVIERVTSIRGIGRWSADWLLARCLGRDDAIAAGDLGVRKAVSRWVIEADELASADAIRNAVAEWGSATNWSVHLLLEKLAAS